MDRELTIDGRLWQVRQFWEVNNTPMLDVYRVVNNRLVWEFETPGVTEDTDWIVKKTSEHRQAPKA